MTAPRLRLVPPAVVAMVAAVEVREEGTLLAEVVMGAVAVAAGVVEPPGSATNANRQGIGHATVRMLAVLVAAAAAAMAEVVTVEAAAAVAMAEAAAAVAMA